MTPSLDAREIDRAHKVLRDALGTPREALARAYLETVVAKVKRRSLPAWCCASGCQGCTEFHELAKETP